MNFTLPADVILAGLLGAIAAGVWAWRRNGKHANDPVEDTIGSLKAMISTLSLQYAERIQAMDTKIKEQEKTILELERKLVRTGLLAPPAASAQDAETWDAIENLTEDEFNRMVFDDWRDVYDTWSEAQSLATKRVSVMAYARRKGKMKELLESAQRAAQPRW